VRQNGGNARANTVTLNQRGLTDFDPGNIRDGIQRTGRQYTHIPTSTPRSRIRGRVSVWANATNPVAHNKAIMKRDFVVIKNMFS
jgi:hypothetical protein